MKEEEGKSGVIGDDRRKREMDGGEWTDEGFKKHALEKGHCRGE
jgi:hypothetical protein